MDSIAISSTEKCLVLAKIYQSISLYFAHWEDALFRKEDLDEVFKNVVERVYTVKTEIDFSLILLEFVAKLNNGHTSFNPNRRLYGLPLGFYVVPVNNKWVVINSTLTDIMVGDQIVEVEGKHLDYWYDELKRYLSVGNSDSKHFLLFDLIGMFLPEKFSLNIENRQGQRSHRIIERSLSLRDQSEMKTEGKWVVENKIAYIKIPSFGEPGFEEGAINYLTQFQIAQALIFDVRGNSGGSTPIKLMKELMDRPFRWYAESTPVNIGIHTLQSVKKWNEDYYDSSIFLRPPYQEPQKAAYRGELIILTDKGTGSAAEDFVLPFKDNGRATIIGQTTFGSTGQPFYHVFSNGMSFRISTKRAYFPEGSPFEGHGITPDLNVSFSREDLYSHHDPVLSKALELAQR